MSVYRYYDYAHSFDGETLCLLVLCNVIFFSIRTLYIMYFSMCSHAFECEYDIHRLKSYIFGYVRAVYGILETECMRKKKSPMSLKCETEQNGS